MERQAGHHALPRSSRTQGASDSRLSPRPQIYPSRDDESYKGSSVLTRILMGEGFTPQEATPHPIRFVSPPYMPSPTRGERLSWLSSALPWPIVSENGIEDGQELS